MTKADLPYLHDFFRYTPSLTASTATKPLRPIVPPVFRAGKLRGAGGACRTGLTGPGRYLLYPRCVTAPCRWTPIFDGRTLALTSDELSRSLWSILHSRFNQTIQSQPGGIRSSLSCPWCSPVSAIFFFLRVLSVCISIIQIIIYKVNTFYLFRWLYVQCNSWLTNLQNLPTQHLIAYLQLQT